MNVAIDLSGFQEVQHELTVLATDKAEGFLNRTAQDVASSIHLRVSEHGIGSTGPLRKYSNTYSHWKSKRGRQTRYRDLTFSGKLWQSLGVFGLPHHKLITFAGEMEKTKAKGNEQRSPFFSLTNTEYDIINSNIREFKL